MTIEFDKVKKIYPNSFGLELDKISIKPGETIGLVGNNGAGKTTMLKLLLDLIEPSNGQIKIAKQNISNREDWKKEVGAFMSVDFLIPFLTPNEYFKFIGSLLNCDSSTTENHLKEFKTFLNTATNRNKKLIRDYSMGNQVKIGIVSALLFNPKIIVFDEPFTNLDPTSQLQLRKMLLNFSTDKSITLIISSHNLQYVTDICGRIILLDKGKIKIDTAISPQIVKEITKYFEFYE